MNSNPQISTTTPEVFLIAAITTDGFIARSKDEFASWTSKEDKARFVALTKEAGVMIMGATTFKTFPKPLKDRHHIVYSRSDMFEEKWPDGNVETTSPPPHEIIDSLAKRGYSKIAICGGSSIYSLFMNSGLVTKLYLTIEPIIFGDGIKLFNEKVDISDDESVQASNHVGIKLKLESCEKTEGGTLFLTYSI